MKKKLLYTLFAMISCNFAMSQCGYVLLQSQAEIESWATANPTCTSLSYLIINEDNGVVTDLSPLGFVNSVVTLYIDGTTGLTDLSGLNLSSVSNAVQISWTTTLTSLTGLENVTSMYKLQVNNNADLLNLSGLENLNSVVEITIVSNGSLESLLHMNSIDYTTISINNKPSIHENPILATCESDWLCDYIENVSTTLTIVDNAVGCNNVGEVETACAAISLPIELLGFSGRLSDLGVELVWQTANEVNNYGFQIENSSDSKSWQIIDFVEGKGIFQEVVEYQYTDQKPVSGINYYRLKQVDFNGEFEYSEIITVRNEKNLVNEIQVYPNPSQGIIKIQLSNSSGQLAKLKIMDQLGRKIWEFSGIATESILFEEMEIVQNGVYYLIAQVGSQRRCKKVIINN